MRFKQNILCFLLFSLCPIGHVAGLVDIPMRAPLIASKIGIVDLSSLFNEYVENLDLLKEARFRDQEIETGIKELSAKFEQPEFLDSLSAKEEEVLHAKFRALMNDQKDSRTQILQIMRDAQKLLEKITFQACEIVAQERQLDCIVDKHSCLYIHLEENWAYDVTSFVLTEINKILNYL